MLIPRPRIFFLLLTLLTAFVVQAQESDPQALKIFDRALSRLDSNNRALERYQYYQTLTTIQYDDDGDPIGKGSWKSVFRPGDKDPIQYLDEKKEGKLTFFKDEPQKPAQAAKSDRPDADRSDQEEQALDTNKLKSVADAVEKYSLKERYLWTRLPDEQTAGEDAYVIEYEPRAEQSVKSREERLFSLLQGKIWLSKEDYTVLKSEGSLQTPYRLLWIIARLTRLNFTYEAEPSPASRLLRRSEAHAETIVVLPFNTIRQKHTLTVEKYETRSKR